ncbi:MAG: FAD binding domain-containing protein [Acetobacteraceae bacterium]|nr:FAD binding domain-containing protein [Acetobacteraceae bacterium]
MKPASFDYIRAESDDQVLAALHAHGADARILAGGQTLVPMLSMRLVRPAVLIDIMRVPTLSRITDRSDAIVIAAAVRQQETLSRPTLADEVPLLAAALPWVGHYQTRARGTICGSAAHADPSAEIPLCLVALNGEIALRARHRRRRVGAEAFFAGMMVTDRRDDELIASVSFPKRRHGTGYAFAEFGRRHGDFAIVACAAVVDATRMRLAVAGVADQPMARDFPILQGSALDDAVDQFAWDLQASDDIHATARYRRDLVRQIGRRVLEEAACHV